MPSTGDGIWEAYRTDEFVLVVGQNESPGVTKVSPLDLGEIETIEQPDAGSGKTYKIAGQKLKFKPLTIERYVDGSPEDKVFMDWFKETFNLGSGTQNGSSARRSGQIIKRGAVVGGGTTGHRVPHAFDLVVVAVKPQSHIARIENRVIRAADSLHVVLGNRRQRRGAPTTHHAFNREFQLMQLVQSSFH